MSDATASRSADRLARIRDHVREGMSRREFFRTLATGGYALGMAHFLGVEDFLAADDGEVPVVTALVRSDPDDPWSLEERTEYVPADWYAAVESAIELNDRLSRAAFTGYLGSAVVPEHYDDGGAAVSVGVSGDLDSIRDAVGDLSEGVSLNVREIVDVEAVEDDSDRYEPRMAESLTSSQIPAGIACETPSSLATLGPAMFDPESQQRYFVTAEHAFEEQDEVDGALLSLPISAEEPVELGPVRHAYPVEDVAAIEPNGSLAPSMWIDAPEPVRVRGQLTRWGLADLIARDERLEKVGALTGHTTGRVQGFDAVTCFTDDFCRRGQIRWGGEMDLTDGDSGSASYYDDPDGNEEDVLVAGFNNARTWWPGQSYVWGVAAYRVTEQYGYHF
ncbi:hypothetical protein C491_02230 [Natronococcus amylolyticus DSM 10524]|uniref:Uncharacterized protein n=1 Tax=Natronococcus amylolyticus DSM 10524 TaxID=1227497 RepID=L9XEC3_9EURY|nr:hypothetical protein [Natronococcus amylolyticus]ELY60080.1 hypothetical protein C491_02230 [Natronococcus amylolyticus DSM 10524]